MEADPTKPDVANLAHRRNNGVEVFLNWHRAANILSIVLIDEQDAKDWEFVVPNDKGMQAFEHPYAWLPDQVAAIQR